MTVPPRAVSRSAAASASATAKYAIQCDGTSAGAASGLVAVKRCDGVPEAALADLLQAVAEDVGVEGLARLVAAAHRLGPAEGPGLVDEVGARVLLGLPQAVGGPRRVGADGEATHLQDVHRPEEEDAARRPGALRRGVDVVGREVDRPRADLARVVRVLGHGARYDVAVLAGHDVAAGLGREGLEGPAEEAAVEVAGTVEVVDHDVGPARRSGCEGLLVDGHGRLLVCWCRGQSRSGTRSENTSPSGPLSTAPIPYGPSNGPWSSVAPRSSARARPGTTLRVAKDATQCGGISAGHSPSISARP